MNKIVGWIICGFVVCIPLLATFIDVKEPDTKEPPTVYLKPDPPAPKVDPNVQQPKVTVPKKQKVVRRLRRKDDRTVIDKFFDGLRRR